MAKVFLNGAEIDMEAAANLMDDEIRERLHIGWIGGGEQEFLDAYVKAHAEKFDGEEFSVG